MDKKEYSRVYKVAINKFGENEQIGVAQEECAELIAVLSHYRRSINNHKLSKRDRTQIMNHVTEEMADVEIMIDQLKIIMNNNAKIGEIKNSKIERLQKRIGKIKMPKGEK